MSAASPTRPSRRATSRRKVIVDDDGSDVENIILPSQADDDDAEEYTPAPKSTRKSPRRRVNGSTTNASRQKQGISTGHQARKADAAESTIEPSEIFDAPEETLLQEPVSPTKRPAPKRRTVKDARAARQSRALRESAALEASELHQSLPTPESTATPEPRSRRGTPLSDITDSTLNERTLEPPELPTAPPTPADDITICSETAKAASPAMSFNESEAMEGVESTGVAVTPKAMPVKMIDPNVTKLDKPMDIIIKKRALGIQPSQEPAEPKARMTITYLTLENFKSYAGKQIVGPFHTSFSSVVGPNGSGKSNVIDSLLFVFGFRASKMRQGKISALIHNSARFPDLDYCEVEVQFQMVMDEPGGGTTVVPDSQLVISRRAFKNNSSKYYINGRTSDFTSVTTLLKDRGVDLDHKRFLILQGEVESIAQMKPKAAGEHDDGLLEYLEDIIGTSKYKTPIEEAATETETLNEVCSEKSGRVQHVEKEKNGLEDKKNKALAFIRDENELILKKSARHQWFLANCEVGKQMLEEDISRLEVELNEELERHQGAEHDIKGLEREYKAGAKQQQKIQNDTADILKHVDNLDKANVKIEEKKKHLNNKSKKFQKALEGSQHGMHESETLAVQAGEDIVRITNEVEELEQEMQAEDKELDKIRASLKGKTQDLSDEIAAKQELLQPWNAKINEKQSMIDVAQSELDILRERENAGSKAVADAEAKLVGLQEQAASRTSAIRDCEKQRKTVDKELQSAHKQLDAVYAQIPDLQSKLSGARQKADEARASLSASKSQGEVLAALTRLSESGRIEGFHGRLGNLGAIDSKYDVAISTACPALDNLVVETVEGAQQCIAYLRKNSLGRANFIVLDRLAQRDLSPIETPENCPRLFDLVKSKHDRYYPAFYHVLQNTLVANDSAQADRVAYGARRWRVVTLDGKLVDKSGVMSGGGSKVARGAMSSKAVTDVTKDQVAKLEVDRDALEQKHSELQRQQNDFETQIRELEKKIPALETEAQKLNLERDSVERNISDAQQRIRELTSGQQNAKSDKGKISGLEKNIAAMQGEIERLQSESKGIETEIESLQDKIMQVGGVKLRSQKAKVDGLKEQIESLNETLSTAEISKAKAEKQRVKFERSSQDASEEIDKIANDIAKVEEEARSQNDDTSGLRRQAEEAQQALDDKRDELKELKKRLDDQIADLNEARGAEVELRTKIEDAQKRLASDKDKLGWHQEELAKLTLHNIGEDGEEGDPEPVPELSRDELEALNVKDIEREIAPLEERTSQHVDLSVLSEYRRRVNEHSNRLEDLNAALAARDAAKKRLDDMRRLRLEGFMEGFSLISMRLKEMYQMITMGGNAELELVDSLDPFSEGILFSVMPPKKSWKNISNLSGGEKTLSSLALVFALHHYKPTPLYVMDEIDAALDFRNVSIVAAYIKERTKNAQFIVISLRNNMFELASRLVGVYKVNHMTKSVTVENRDYIVPQTGR